MSLAGNNGSTSVTSSRIPYIPVQIEIPEADASISADALVDTGFNGEVAIPVSAIRLQPSVLGNIELRMADGSEVSAPVYLGTVRIGTRQLGPVTGLVLGDEPIVGLGVITQFRVVIDHDESISFSA